MFTVADRAKRRKAMMELGACVSLLEKCHSLGYDRMQQELTKVVHLVKVTGRSDCKTFSLASTCYFVSIFPRVFVYAFFLCFFPVARKSALKESRGETCSNIDSALSQSTGET